MALPFLFNAYHFRPRDVSDEAWQRFQSAYSLELAWLSVKRAFAPKRDEVIEVGGFSYRVEDILPNVEPPSQLYWALEILSALAILSEFVSCPEYHIAIRNIREQHGFPLPYCPPEEAERREKLKNLDEALALLLFEGTRDDVICLGRILSISWGKTVYATYSTAATPVEPDIAKAKKNLSDLLFLDSELGPNSTSIIKVPASLSAWSGCGHSEDVWWIGIRSPLATSVFEDFSRIPANYMQRGISDNEFYACISPTTHRVLLTDNACMNDLVFIVDEIAYAIHGAADVESAVADKISLAKLEQPSWENTFRHNEPGENYSVSLSSATSVRNSEGGKYNVTVSPHEDKAYHEVSWGTPERRRERFSDLTEVTMTFSFKEGGTVHAHLNKPKNEYKLTVGHKDLLGRSRIPGSRTAISYMADAMYWLAQKGFVSFRKAEDGNKGLGNSMRALIRGGSHSFLKEVCRHDLFSYVERCSALVIDPDKDADVIMVDDRQQPLRCDSDGNPIGEFRNKYNSTFRRTLPKEAKAFYSLSVKKMIDSFLGLTSQGGYTLSSTRLWDSNAYLVGGIPQYRLKVYLTLSNSDYDLECIMRHCGVFSRRIVVITTDESELTEKFEAYQNSFSHLPLETLLESSAPLADLIGETSEEAEIYEPPFKKFWYIREVAKVSIPSGTKERGKFEWKNVKIELTADREMVISCESPGRSEPYSHCYPVKSVEFCCAKGKGKFTPYDILLFIAYSKGEPLNPVESLGERRGEVDTARAGNAISELQAVVKQLNDDLRVFFEKSQNFYCRRQKGIAKDPRQEMFVTAKARKEKKSSLMRKWSGFHFYINVSADGVLFEEYRSFLRKLRESLLDEKEKEGVRRATEALGGIEQQFNADKGDGPPPK